MGDVTRRAQSPTELKEKVMLLAQTEIEPILRQLKAAFPKLTDWEYSNEKAGDYFGFTVWAA